jgi:hypothetical protein
MRIYQTVAGRQQLVGTLNAWNKEALHRLTVACNKHINTLKDKTWKAAPTSTWKLTRSIRPVLIDDPSKRSDSTILATKTFAGFVRSTARHSIFVEFGSGPMGNRTNNAMRPSWHEYGDRQKFPPLKKIKAWAMTRPGANPWKVAWGIVRNKGVRARPFLFNSFEPMREQVVRDMREALDFQPGEVGSMERSEFWSVGDVKA